MSAPDVSEFRKYRSFCEGAGITDPLLIRLVKGGKEPDTNGKKLKLDDKSLNPDLKLSWDDAEKAMTDGFNIGHYASPDGILHLDCDLNKGSSTIPQEIIEDLIKKADTLSTKTRSGGRHLHFLSPGELFSNPHIYWNNEDAGELRTYWQYVVVPGSFVPKEKPSKAGKTKGYTPDADGYYRLINEKPLKPFDFSIFPDGLTIKEAGEKKGTQKKHSQERVMGLSDDLIIQEAKRIFKDDFNILLSGSSEGYKSPSEADYRFCCILSKFCDDWFQVASLLIKYRYRPEFDTNSKWKVQETALNAWNNRDERYNLKSGRLDPLSPVSAISDDIPGLKDRDDTPLSITQLNLTDIGNASRFIALYGDKFRYDFTQKSWYYWNGEIWLVDNNGCAKKAAQYTVAKMAEEIEVLYKQEDKKHADMVFKHMRKSASEKDRNNMLNTAAPYLSVTPGTWNSKPELLNLQNGTLNLETFKLQEFNQEDYLTFKAGVRYDPKAKCPEWIDHLSLVFGNDTELISAFQLMAGYSLLSGNPSQVFFIPFGSGKNGKSVTINALRMIMGDYGIHIAPQSLMIQKNPDKIRSDLVRIRYKRFVTSSEGEQGAKLDIGWIKQISGGEPIVAAEKYKNEVEFKVEAVIWFATNHKPIINEINEAIWRRLWIIPFNQVIPENKRIVDYDKKLIESEGSGILNWMIEGLKRYYEAGGLIKPKAITEAIEEYMIEEDPLGDYLNENCVIEPGAKITDRELFMNYCEWCLNNGIKYHMKKNGFTRNLLDHQGIKSGRTKATRLYLGIRLKDDNDRKREKEEITKDILEGFI